MGARLEELEAGDEAGLKKWFSAYLNWADDEPNGKHENDAEEQPRILVSRRQTATYALFVGDTALARRSSRTPSAIGGRSSLMEVSRSSSSAPVRCTTRASKCPKRCLVVAEIGTFSSESDLWNYQRLREEVF
jgi:hypothetical protein